MHPPLSNETKPFWSVVHAKKKEYPYWCMTSALSPVAAHVKGKHVRVVHGDEAFWGFPDQERYYDFRKRYNAQNWSP